MKKKPFWLAVPSWIILGSLAILIPLFTLMTMQSINAQRELTTQLLFEKGDALVRSFEAGARTGLGMKWGSFEIQKLLIDTAQQPGVDYLIVTDLKGKILADSDPTMVGETYGSELESLRETKTGQAFWRRITRTEQSEPGGPEKTENTFEVYHYFSLSDSDAPDAVIFLGLDMDPVLAARNQDIMRTVVIAAVLLLLSIAGILFLLLAQAYRSARSSLARAEAMSETLIRNMPIGLVALDLSGRFVSMNEAAGSLLGVESESLEGRGSAEILPGALQDAIASVLRNSGSSPGTGSGRDTFAAEAQCRVGGRENATLEIMAALMRDDDGEPLGAVALFRDLTEIRQLREEIARSQRLASIGNLAAGVAHEIRNPLSSIKGFATYFKERYRDNPEDSGTAQIMIEEVDRLNRVISQLLELARPSGVRLETRDVCDLIRHVLVLVRRQAEAGAIELIAHMPDCPAFAEIDQDKMEQALLNVFLNAVQASPVNGAVSVTVEKEGGRVRIGIADEGKGISEQDLPRIFDPYFTTKPSGTGLGLAIVSKIVEAHRGEVRAVSREGQGTKIEISIPEKSPDKTEKEHYETKKLNPDR